MDKPKSEHNEQAKHDGYTGKVDLSYRTNFPQVEIVEEYGRFKFTIDGFEMPDVIDWSISSAPNGLKVLNVSCYVATNVRAQAKHYEKEQTQ